MPLCGIRDLHRLSSSTTTEMEKGKRGKGVAPSGISAPQLFLWFWLKRVLRSHNPPNSHTSNYRADQQEPSGVFCCAGCDWVVILHAGDLKPRLIVSPSPNLPETLAPRPWTANIRSRVINLTGLLEVLWAKITEAHGTQSQSQPTRHAAITRSRLPI